MQALRKSGWNQVAELEIAVRNLKAQTQGIPQQQYGFIADGRAIWNAGNPPHSCARLELHLSKAS
jgi:hypothetical protein